MNKPPDTQPNASAHRRIPFWRIVGAALVGGLLISLAAMLIGPGFSGRARPEAARAPSEAARAPSEAARAWSDALCASAFLVALGSALPILFDAGRGVAMLGKLGRAASTGDDAREEQRRVWQNEHRKREQGITITFALALAAFFIGLISIIAGLW